MNQSQVNTTSSITVPDSPEVYMGRYLYDYVDYLFHAEYYSDKRVINWPLMNTAWPTICISLSYVFLMCWVGPYLMTGRKPFHLNKTMMYYNVFQVAFNCYLVTQFIRGGWFNGYSWICQPVERAPSPRGQIMISAIWWYFMSKFMDFFDTVFMVLRKNYKQISFLHIGHHGTLPICCWYIARFMGGGQVSFVCFLNSAVHVVMYSYYSLAGLGPQMKKYLWWKKYLTVVQMVQFVMILFHEAQLLFVECDYPKYQIYWGFLFGPWIFILFLNFYMDSYRLNH